MNKILPIIGAAIILSGLIWYTQQLVSDYNKGVEQVETIGSEENAHVKVVQASVLADMDYHQDAIDLLLKTIKENPKNLEPQVKLAQLYVINCLKLDKNCDDALWQLNVILAIDSVNVPAKQMLEQIKHIIHPNAKIIED